MTGFGTMVNAAAILLGSTVGLLLKGGLPKRLQDIITSAVGLCVIFVGASGALAGLLAVSGDGLETRDTMMMIFSMAAGAALGEWMDIERIYDRRFGSAGSEYACCSRGVIDNRCIMCIHNQGDIGCIEYDEINLYKIQ